MSRVKHCHPSARSSRSGRPLPCAWRRFLKTCRSGAAGLIVLTSLAFADPANAASVDRWQPYPGVGFLEGVVLRLHWFDTSAALREAAKNSGVNDTDLKGFSTLKRNTATGEYVCDVYFVRMTGAPVDGDNTTTFGHEVLHCLGLRHEDTLKARVR
jgi:hypothetical protein